MVDKYRSNCSASEIWNKNIGNEELIQLNIFPPTFYLSSPLKGIIHGMYITSRLIFTIIFNLMSIPYTSERKYKG